MFNSIIPANGAGCKIFALAGGPLKPLLSSPGTLCKECHGTEDLLLERSIPRGLFTARGLSLLAYDARLLSYSRETPSDAADGHRPGALESAGLGLCGSVQVYRVWR